MRGATGQVPTSDYTNGEAALFKQWEDETFGRDPEFPEHKPDAPDPDDQMYSPMRGETPFFGQ
jgi:hypothetical protein